MRAHPTLRIALAVCLLLGPAALANASVLPVLQIARSGIAAMLTWKHVYTNAARYELWRSDDHPYALPGTVGATLVGQAVPGPQPNSTLTLTDADTGLGDPKRNSFYVVRGVTASGTPAAPSNRVGEFDFRLGGGCTIFPTDNVWNTRADTLPLDARSAAYVTSISATAGMHADFGSGTWDGGPIGIPFTTVPGTQPKVSVAFDYSNESDPGPYPIPADAPIEGGPSSTGDRHVVLLDSDDCVLYELYYAWPQPDGSWQAGSGAIFNLQSNALRPDTWTSADAAGLPILPGLVRYAEAVTGTINHALRFTAPRTRRAYVWPARHYASSQTDPNLPPMGQRFRLRADFDISGFSPINQAILRTLKHYGMFLADNGSSWYLSGVPDERWNNDDLHLLQTRVHGSDFEAVDESSLMIQPDSGQARQP
jgi:hypothetical protein